MDKLRRSASKKFYVSGILIVFLMPCLSALTVAQPRSTALDLSLPSYSSWHTPANQPQVTGAPISVDWRSYHNYTSLVSLLTLLNQSYPDLVDVYAIGETWQGRYILCVRITDEHVDNSSKGQILIVSEHHAREVITQEAALYFTIYLLTRYQTDANIQDLLRSKEIYIIPCLNPDGMEAALTYNSFQRKNMRPIDDDGDGLVDEDTVKDRNSNDYLECYEFDTNVGTGNNPQWVISNMAYEGNATRGDGVYTGFISDNPGGVDLNRNYDFHFNDTYETSSNSTNPRVEDYKGTSPFSEPETRAVKQLLESHSFIFAMSLHSGTEVLLREWSYTTDISSLGANYTLFNMFGKTFEESSGYPYPIGTGNLGYNCSGEFGDWMYGVKKIPAMTCEVYGNVQAYQQRSVSPNGDEYIWWGVWSFFNPPNSMIEQICLRTLSLLLHVSSINYYSSIRTYSAPRSLALNDGSNTLNLTWTYTGVQDICMASYRFLPFEARSGGQVAPVSNVFSILSDKLAHDIQLTFVYSDQELSTAGVNENDVEVLKWDSQRGQWSKLEPSLRDTNSNLITVGTDVTGNTPYYFMLALFSPSSGTNPNAILVMAFASIVGALFFVAIIRNRGRGNRTLTQAQEVPAKDSSSDCKILRSP